MNYLGMYTVLTSVETVVTESEIDNVKLAAGTEQRDEQTEGSFTFTPHINSVSVGLSPTMILR